VYFRLFYIFPFPLVIGIVIAALYVSSGQLSSVRRSLLWIGVCAISAISIWITPTSIVRAPVYVWGNWLADQDLARARALIASAPPGVRLAPYPLSGAIRMLDSNYPQLITRNDLMLYYLGLQGLDEDARLRVRTKAFLTGDADYVRPMASLLEDYPE